MGKSDGSGAILQFVDPKDAPLAQLESRFFFVGVNPKSRVLDSSVAEQIVQGLIQADFSNGHPVILVCSGPGGHVASTFAIADAVSMCRSPTIAVAIGEVCSGHAHVFMSAERRYMTPTSRIMFHDPCGYPTGSPEELKNQAAYLDRDRQVIVDRLLATTKLTKKNIDDAMLKEKYWTPVESKKAGICHKVIDDWSMIAKHINHGV